VNFGLLAAEIVSLVCGTPANFNGFCVLAALLHGTLVAGVSETLRRWTEGATYIQQGGHHVGHVAHILVELRFHIPLDTEYIISETLFLANLVASTEKTKIKNRDK